MKARYLLFGLTLLALTVVSFAVVSFVTQSTSDRIGVVGVLKKGVEAGCAILETDGGRVYTLIDLPNFGCGSSNASLDLGQVVLCIPPYGRKVAVTGYIERNAAGYCMQGPLLHVESMTVLE
jgi:hypothetical protein